MNWKYAAQQIACRAFGVRFLSVEEVDQLALDLTKKIKASNFQPDIVVGILRGGYYPSQKVAQNLELPRALIDIARPRTQICGIELENLLLIQKFLGYPNREPELNPFSPLPRLAGYERALIVDDDCMRGKTFEVARKAIKSQVLEIREASLFCYRDDYHPEFYAEEIAPLFSFIKGAKRFPWLRYSPHFENYRQTISASAPDRARSITPPNPA